LKICRGAVQRRRGKLFSRPRSGFFRHAQTQDRSSILVHF
jgi:hypothetical protein